MCLYCIKFSVVAAQVLHILRRTDKQTIQNMCMLNQLDLQTSITKAGFQKRNPFRNYVFINRILNKANPR